MSADLATLKNNVTDSLDIAEYEKEIAGIEVSLKEPAAQLEEIKDAKNDRLNNLVELRAVIERNNKTFKEISRPLSKAIDQFGTLRKNWLEEKQRWSQWQSALLKDGDLVPLRSTFSRAIDTIDKALEVVVAKLNSMLAVQERASNVEAKIIVFSTELDALISGARSGIKVKISPPMFSSQYVSQYSNELWYALQKGLIEIAWPDSHFLDQQGLIIFVHVFCCLVVIIAIYQNRQMLYDSKRWHFLAARPLSAGLFFSTLAILWFYEQLLFQDMFGLAIATAAGVSFSRIIGALNQAPWRMKFVYGLTIVLLVTQLLQVIKLPMPLFRLYTALTALVGIVISWRWAGESVGEKDARFYCWLLRAGALFLAFITVAEISGKNMLAEYLFISLIRSTAIVIGYMLFIYMIRGFLELVFRRSSLHRAAFFHKNADLIIRRLVLFVNVALFGLLLFPTILSIWGVFDSLPAAIKGFLETGVNVGSQRINVGLVVVSASILYGSYLVSWIVQKVLIDEVLAKRLVEKGVRLSIARLVNYVLISVGFILALAALGIEVTKLTIILSALGVGIGFGLQSIVNNFVSGLILLFERPVREGDYIELDGEWAEIIKIGLRATAVQTFDQADVIIPNADLVSNKVVNWTLRNRLVRLIIPVGVAYGSDVSLVIETLMASTKKNSNIAKTPSPQVLFLNFGESSLDFELRVWVQDADQRMEAKSELNQEIDRKFREAKIEIAFPQRDLHLRSVDQSVSLKPVGTIS
ncbi:hypothetical protein DSCW_59590 [Desulfosarcina widdelii]|uniref:Mechanosensitive ion channel protein n=1 Tax=Desulfosarcina widdelii TaxID=947919 RepID=A0A5K7Z942_9BACT|nr:hypothetical protein DSCW_59590 [Desulfosarcina widdelii]